LPTNTFRFFDKGIPANILPADLAYTLQAHIDEVERIVRLMMQQTDHYALQQKSNTQTIF